MIKYFCDRCGHELTAYEYENHCTTISKDVAFDERYKYKLCDFCTAQFSKFISGEEVKRVERVKENSEMNTIAEKYDRAIVDAVGQEEQFSIFDKFRKFIKKDKG